MGAGIKVLKYHIYGSRYQIVPFMGTGIKALYRKEQCSILHIVPFTGTGIKILLLIERNIIFFIVPLMGTGIKNRRKKRSTTQNLQLLEEKPYLHFLNLKQVEKKAVWLFLLMRP